MAEDNSTDSTVPQGMILNETNYDVTVDINLIEFDLHREEESPPSLEEYPFDDDPNDPLNSILIQNVPRITFYTRMHLPYLLLFLIKAVIDHFSAFLSLVILYISVHFFNKVVKRELEKRSHRSIGFLLVAICHLAITIFLFYYLNSDPNLRFGLIFIFQYTESLTMTKLLLSISLNDLILKLITIFFKIICMMLPIQFLPINNRGNMYNFIEATSQLYRCCMPIEPWIFYYVMAYEGFLKPIGIVLSVIYLMAKFRDFKICVKQWWEASNKVVHISEYPYLVPTKEELTIAGCDCPICQEKYVNPVMTKCHHMFCADCVDRWFVSNGTCPICRTVLIDNPIWSNASSPSFIRFL